MRGRYEYQSTEICGFDSCAMHFLNLFHYKNEPFMQNMEAAMLFVIWLTLKKWHYRYREEYFWNSRYVIFLKFEGIYILFSANFQIFNISLNKKEKKDKQWVIIQAKPDRSSPTTDFRCW